MSNPAQANPATNPNAQGGTNPPQQIAPLLDDRPKTDEDIINTIDKRFFLENFDVMGYVWQVVGEDPNAVPKIVAERERQLESLTNKLSTKVLDSYDSFMEAMRKIQELEQDLNNTKMTCRATRYDLKNANNELAIGGLTISGLHRRRSEVNDVLTYVEQIKSLLQKKDELKKTIESRDFPRAIQMCLDAQSTAHMYAQFNCVTGMRKIIQDEYDNLVQKIDSALMDCCLKKFEPQEYERVLVAYNLLRKNIRVFEKIQKNFTAVIELTSRNVVAVFAHRSLRDSKVTVEGLKRDKFVKLCKKLTDNQIVPCIYKLFENMCDLMYTHHSMLFWHKQYDLKGEKSKFFTDIKQGLLNNTKSIWEEMQTTIKIVFENTKIDSLTIDRFLQVLDATTQFVDIGEEFSQSAAHGLRAMLKKQSTNYFMAFHKERMEELGKNLTNELWEKTQLPSNFNYRDVKEVLSFVEDTYNAANNKSNNNNPTKKRKIAFSVQYETYGNPFSEENVNSSRNSTIDFDSPNMEFIKREIINKQQKQLILDDDEDPELLVDFVDEEGGLTLSPTKAINRSNEMGPLLTATVLNNLAREVGVYLHLMKVLPAICDDIWDGITQLFEYYVYTVYSIFSPPLETFVNGVFMSPKLRSVLLRMKSRVVLDTFDLDPNVPPPAPTRVSEMRFARVRLAKPVDLEASGTLYSLPQMVVSMESLKFIYDIVVIIRPFVAHYITDSNKKAFADFYELTVGMIPELRLLCYEGLCDHFVKVETHLNNINLVKWDVKDIPVDANPYIAQMVKEFSMFEKRYNVLSKKELAFPSTAAKAVIFDAMVKHVMEIMIEGTSRVKKWSTEGRAVLSIDLRVLQGHLEKILGTKQIPHIALADNYIKAFYELEDKIVPWLNGHHQDYSKNQLLGLINNGPWNRGTKTNALALINQVKPEPVQAQPGGGH